MNCDLLFIKPSEQKTVYGGLSDFQLTAFEPPLWAALLAAYARAKGYNAEILDTQTENFSFEDTYLHIKSLMPRLLVICVSGTNPSASTMNMLAAEKIIRICKENMLGIPVALHGIHPSALPEESLMNGKADFVCMGEGFECICALLECLKNDKPDKLPKIDGLAYRQGDKIYRNKAAEIINDLDSLPRAAWDLLPMQKYRAHNWHCFDDISRRQAYAILWTSLGCPFNCHFCCINSIFGKKPGIRYRHPQKIIEEIDFLVNEYGVRNIKIVDELFAVNEKRVIEICRLITERKYDLNIWAYARVDTVSKKMLHAMKNAGINWLAYGFESGSRKSLDAVGKGYDLDAVSEITNMTYGEGLYIIANYLFGLPDDDYEGMLATLVMAMEINAEWANFSSVMAYPGSGLYDDALRQNLRLPDSWQGYSQYSYDCFPMDTKHLKAEQVLAFRDYAFDTYYKNPMYLEKIKQRFGTETVKHIRKITEYSLKRKHTEGMWGT